MDGVRTLVPLARVLLAHAEAGRDGVVSIVRADGRTARIGLTGGRVVMLAGVDVEPFAETVRALSSHPLSASGASTRVVHALEVQLVRGLARLVSARPTQVSFAATTHESARAALVSIDLASVVWSVLLERALTMSDESLRALAGERSLRLTSLGVRRVEALVRAAESGLLAHAHALSGAVSALPSIDDAAVASALAFEAHGSRARLVLCAVLRALGAATPDDGHDAFALLLRKRRELSRNVSASELLDLPESAGAQHARRAFRRLALQLHPDRFHHCDARLCAVSNEVMGALARAEHALRSEVRAARSM